jgi:hypothetical protein
MNHDPIRSQAQPNPQPSWPDEAALVAEQDVLATEAMGWQMLEAGAYLHLGTNEWVVDIVGQAHPGMQAQNVLWILI